MWAGGENCFLSTAGAVIALLADPEYHELAIESAQYLQTNIIKASGPYEGSLPSGQGSNYILPNYLGWAILAFCKAYNQTKESKFLESATTLSDWAARYSQLSNGRIKDTFRINTRDVVEKSRSIAIKSYSTGNSVLIPALHETGSLLGDNERYRFFIERSLRWLRASQTPDGAIGYQDRGSHFGPIPSSFWATDSQEITSVLRSAMSSDFPIDGDEGTGDESLEWLKDRVGPGGLFHQFYWNGGHSVEEDVMPTAFFARMLLEQEDPDAERIAVETIKAIIRSQIHDRYPNANGGIRGLPSHPTRGESAIAWDTQFALMLLQSCFQKGVS